jgi:hypothetical protein
MGTTQKAFHWDIKRSNMDLFVQYNEVCTHSESEPVEYGSWSESYDFSVEGVSLTSRDRYREEKLGCLVDVQAGDPVFVLYMTYDTGDTFGRAEGKGEVIWVFKDSALAMKAKAQWETENNKRDPEFSIEFEADGGIMVKQSNPAAGYFENVGYVDVGTFLVNP